VTELAPGDYVVARVRRTGTGLYDVIDSPDLTTDDAYFEHGISRVHGFLTERYVEEPRYLIRIPPALRDVAVLLEPLSVAEKGIVEAYEIQRRLKVAILPGNSAPAMCPQRISRSSMTSP
jgi:threonine dehydrogenase-like Zn-dependent dehydrogenase